MWSAHENVCVWRFACRAGECEATERGGGEAMASDADDGDGDAARRTAGVSDRQARAGVASAGKRQHQVPLIGIGQCHAMTASNQVNFYPDKGSFSDLRRVHTAFKKRP